MLPNWWLWNGSTCSLLSTLATGTHDYQSGPDKTCLKKESCLLTIVVLFTFLQINLSYSSVTDVGLLTLASLGCLQSLTILHFRGLTPSGLSAALLACGGLTKVKLHASIKSSLPPPLFRYLEARGCSFQWRDKEFQVYVCFTSITFIYPTRLTLVYCGKGWHFNDGSKRYNSTWISSKKSLVFIKYGTVFCE